MTIFLVDIDGCIADVRDLLPLIKGSGKEKTYEEYYASILKAKPIDWAVKMIEYLWKGNNRVIFLTGRSDRCRQATLDWLRKHFIHNYPKDLYMRKDGDRRPSYIVKRDKLKQILEDTGMSTDSFVAIEDHPQVVAMYNQEGIKCLQVHQEEGVSE